MTDEKRKQIDELVLELNQLQDCSNKLWKRINELGSEGTRLEHKLLSKQNEAINNHMEILHHRIELYSMINK